MTEINEGMVQLLEEAAPARLELDVCRTTAPNISVRSADGEADDQSVLEGHFSTFNDWYEINSWFEGNFLERIAPGAFKRTFNSANSAKDKHRIQVLLEHGFDPTVGDKPLGVPTTLSEDNQGARYEAELFDTSYVRDLLPALRAGVYGSSFRFQVIKDEWNEEPETSAHNPKGIPERTIKEVRVSEFGPTLFPANPSADAGVRSTTDEYYEKLRSRNKDRFEELVERAARSRGVDPATVTTEDEKEDVSEDRTEEESHEVSGSVETGDTETPNEDSQSEHSEDSRSDESTDSPAHSEDSQEESTPDSEGDASRTEDAETENESCAHAFCEKRRAGENTDRKCFFK